MNSKPNVVCIEPLSEGMRNMLKSKLSQECNLYFFDDSNQGMEMLPMADAILVFTKGISKPLIQLATRCQVIQKLGAGYDTIDVQQAKQQGITVAVAKGVNARSVAEHALLLMLAVYKRLPVAHNGILNGKWLKTGLRDFSYELSGKKIGLIGLGSIGKEVRTLLRGFGVTVYYYDKFRLSIDREMSFEINYLPFEQLLTECDVISLHVALSDETYHLINQQALSLVKDTAILINTCRGEVIDETALFQSLTSGRLLGAGLDVFEKEPVQQELELLKLDNVVLSPHISGGTLDAMRRVVERSGDNILRVLKGARPYDEDIVNG